MVLVLVALSLACQSPANSHDPETVTPDGWEPLVSRDYDAAVGSDWLVYQTDSLPIAEVAEDGRQMGYSDIVLQELEAIAEDQATFGIDIIMIREVDGVATRINGTNCEDIEQSQSEYEEVMHLYLGQLGFELSAVESPIGWAIFASKPPIQPGVDHYIALRVFDSGCPLSFNLFVANGDNQALDDFTGFLGTVSTK